MTRKRIAIKKLFPQKKSIAASKEKGNDQSTSDREKSHNSNVLQDGNSFQTASPSQMDSDIKKESDSLPQNATNKLKGSSNDSQKDALKDALEDTFHDEELPFKEDTKKGLKKTIQSLHKQSQKVKGAPMTVGTKVKLHPPSLKVFTKQLQRMKEMRNAYPAPVDTMGCHALADKDAPENEQRFHTLVALLLSSQTKDTITAVAMQKLKEKGLTIPNVLTWNISEIEEMIHPVGFYKRKAVYLKKIAEILKKKNDIPETLEGLLKLPGIGPKMGHLIMTHAWNNCQGIGVDVHVHRISNRLEWVETKMPEETRIALEEWLPREYWEPINGVMVGFGQTICASRPKCTICLLSKDHLCPYFEKVVKEEIENKEKEEPSRKRRKHIHVKEEVDEVV